VRLGGQHHIIPAAAQRLPDDLLRLPRRVHIRGIDEIDARIQRRVDDPDAILMTGITPGAEHHRAQAIGAHPHPSPAQSPHPWPPFPSRRSVNSQESVLTAGASPLAGQRVEGGPLAGGQGDVESIEVLFQPVDPLGAGDGDHRDAEPLLLGIHPGQRDLSGSHAPGVGHRAHRVGNAELAGQMYLRTPVRDTPADQDLVVVHAIDLSQSAGP
jgi:hypothetical protein